MKNHEKGQYDAYGLNRSNGLSKIIYTGHICTSNYMFGRAIRYKLPECIFENFETARVKRG